MQQHYPQLNYIWVCARPEQTVIPGNAIKVQKGSRAYYQAYAKAKYWVSNARLPLYLNKKKKKTKYIFKHGMVHHLSVWLMI